MQFGAILCAVCFAIMFFFMEETIFFRDNSIECEEVVDTRSYNSGTAKNKTSWDKEMPPTTTPSLAISSTAFTTGNINSGWKKYTLFKALPGRPSNLDMLRMIYRPVIMIFRFPTVAWAGFLYGINLAWYNVLNGTASPILTAAPYNWICRTRGLCLYGPYTWRSGCFLLVRQCSRLDGSSPRTTQ